MDHRTSGGARGAEGRFPVVGAARVILDAVCCRSHNSARGQLWVEDVAGQGLPVAVLLVLPAAGAGPWAVPGAGLP
eukprot:3008121-Alexandrium_andersonii.AAC.1